MTEKEEKAIEYLKKITKLFKLGVPLTYTDEENDTIETILKALEQKDKEIQELKEKWDKDTHTLQNQLDLANADRVEKDKMIDLFKCRIVVTENEHKEILKIQEKFLEKDFQDCLIIYFQKKAREENE